MIKRNTPYVVIKEAEGFPLVLGEIWIFQALMGNPNTNTTLVMLYNEKRKRSMQVELEAFGEYFKPSPQVITSPTLREGSINIDIR